MPEIVNIQANIALLDALGVLEPLLADKTTGGNILWATDAYAERGARYAPDAEITQDLITGGENAGIIQTRAQKAAEQQSERTRRRAEVYTPLWVVRMMCDHLDAIWFRRKDGFNRIDPETGRVRFKKNRTWTAYVKSTRMEITCGEGPFLTSRYDAPTGTVIPVRERVGLLDRKLRAVSENTDNETEWLKWAARAFQSCYGYEFQGDSLLIARVNALMTFAEHFYDRWGHCPNANECKAIADIIAWNWFQMDGLTCALPYRTLEKYPQMVISGWTVSQVFMPDAPKRCHIYDWRKGRDVEYLSLKEKGADAMKFDFIIGNPPYQQEDGGAGASASPIYNKFIEEVKKLDPDVLSLIIPAKWYSGGKGLNDFRQEMLNDRDICRLLDWTNSLDCFPNVDVAGGVCVFVRKKGYNDDCLYTNYYHGNETTIKRNLSEFDTFIRYPIAVDIVKKVHQCKERTMDTVVTSRKPFGLATNVKPTDTGDITLRYNKGSGPFKRDNISVGLDMIDKYKVMISYLTAEHAGQPDKSGKFRILSTMELLPPQWVCTETYLIAGSFETESEASNAITYLKTKFVRFLIAQKAVSQHITKDCFSFVPVQNFQRPFTDTVLYEKYGLNQEEISCIEDMIKEMT